MTTQEWNEAARQATMAHYYNVSATKITSSQVRICRHCGVTYMLAAEGIHESAHNVLPNPAGTYRLPCSYIEANIAISEGAWNCITLYSRLGGRWIETGWSAQLLPNGHRLVDWQGVRIRKLEDKFEKLKFWEK